MNEERVNLHIFISPIGGKEKNYDGLQWKSQSQAAMEITGLNYTEFYCTLKMLSKQFLIVHHVLLYTKCITK